jgi:alkylation response protein AidB-like acyl-CoA dehydrogenase
MNLDFSPAEHGGCAWTPTQRYIFDEETVAGDAPFVNPSGLARVAPVIIRYGSEAQRRQRLTDLIVEALCPQVLGYAPAMLEHPGQAGESAAQMAHWLHSRASSIYGGSNEIQKNILAKAVFGL